MKRQNNSWLTLPFRLPWWGSILVATAVYCGLKYGIPELQFDNPILQHLGQAAPSFAPILTIPWLLLAAKQVYDTDIPAKTKDSAEKHQDPPIE
jgi:hypothetical protein